jgi:hypothetical protein
MAYNEMEFHKMTKITGIDEKECYRMTSTLIKFVLELTY